MQQFTKITFDVRERLVIDFKEMPHKTVLVRGHFRSVGDKKVYVRTHYRNK